MKNNFSELNKTDKKQRNLLKCLNIIENKTTLYLNIFMQ